MIAWMTYVCQGSFFLVENMILAYHGLVDLWKVSFFFLAKMIIAISLFIIEFICDV